MLGPYIFHLGHTIKIVMINTISPQGRNITFRINAVIPVLCGILSTNMCSEHCLTSDWHKISERAISQAQCDRIFFHIDFGVSTNKAKNLIPTYKSFSVHRMFRVEFSTSVWRSRMQSKQMI